MLFKWFFSQLILLCILPVVSFALLPGAVVVTNGGKNQSLCGLTSKNLTEILKCVQSGDLTPVEKVFKPVAFNQFSDLVKFCPFKLSTGTSDCSLSTYGNQNFFVSLPIVILSPSVRGNPRHDLIFAFDSEGIITDVRYRFLEGKDYEIRVNDSLPKTSVRLQSMLLLLDYYKTAYFMKDLEYIRRIFDERYLLSRKEDISAKEGLSSRFRREEILDQLRQLFMKESVLNFHAEEVNLKQAPPNSNRFVVTFLQRWNSEHYHDELCMTMVFDFSKGIHPEIQVRIKPPKPFLDEPEIYSDDFLFLE